MLCLGVDFGVFLADRWGSTCIDLPRLMMLGFFGESRNGFNVVHRNMQFTIANGTSDWPVDHVWYVRQVDVAAHAVAGWCVCAGRSAMLTILRIPRPRTLGHRFSSLQFRIFRARFGVVGLRTLFRAHFRMRIGLSSATTTIRQRPNDNYNSNYISNMINVSWLVINQW